uniref:Uncharacterized protein n=1 Tax=Anopheles coluzzii TaxID=1518534 RepID=A0A8W7PXC4_ANOCL
LYLLLLLQLRFQQRFVRTDQLRRVVRGQDGGAARVGNFLLHLLRTTAGAALALRFARLAGMHQVHVLAHVLGRDEALAALLANARLVVAQPVLRHRRARGAGERAALVLAPVQPRPVRLERVDVAVAPRRHHRQIAVIVALVLLERRFRVERLRTLAALVAPFARVQPQMVEQIAPAAEQARTVGALVAALARVHHLVAAQQRVRAERTPARRALEPLRDGVLVAPHVLLERAPGVVPLAAPLARQPLLRVLVVVPQVVIQQIHGREAPVAVLTLVRKAVHHHVAVQLDDAAQHDVGGMFRRWLVLPRRIGVLRGRIGQTLRALVRQHVDVVAEVVVPLRDRLVVRITDVAGGGGVLVFPLLLVLFLLRRFRALARAARVLHPHGPGRIQLLQLLGRDRVERVAPVILIERGGRAGRIPVVFEINRETGLIQRHGVGDGGVVKDFLLNYLLIYIQFLYRFIFDAFLN